MRFTSSGRTGEIILKKNIFKAWKRLNGSGRETFGKQDNEETVGWKRSMTSRQRAGNGLLCLGLKRRWCCATEL